jgi:hypothetical protein
MGTLPTERRGIHVHMAMLLIPLWCCYTSESVGKY